MGRDKATIEFEGEPLWNRQLELLRALSLQQLFVSARTKPEWLPGDAELLLDDPPSRGPLSGLTKALAAIQTTHLIALAVDMPFMTATELEALRQRATEGCGVVPTIGEQAEPLAAIYPTEAAVDFEEALSGSNFSLQAVVRRLAEIEKVRLWAVPGARANFFRSVNEPEEFDA